jgi:hypothetical protein
VLKANALDFARRIDELAACPSNPQREVGLPVLHGELGDPLDVSTLNGQAETCFSAFGT